MSKSNKSILKISITKEMDRAMRERVHVALEREMMRDGRKFRAKTIDDQRKVANKRACRGKFSASE